MEEWTWQDYLDNGFKVILDNDDWWFEKEGYEGAFDGGSGPYGRDLLEYLLERHYSGWEPV